MAIYGCIKSDIQWYTHYTETLHKKGCVIIPYNQCVPKTIILGGKCTIVLYVDDSKESYVNLKLIDDLLSDLKVHFGDLVITRGKKHSFLGRNI